MPTFQTIKLHPELYCCLVSVAKTSREGEGTSLETENSVTEDANTSSAPIQTPVALLARNPSLIRLRDVTTTKVKSLPEELISQLRWDVAFRLAKCANEKKWFQQSHSYQQDHAGRKRKREITSHVSYDTEEESCTTIPGSSSVLQLLSRPMVSTRSQYSVSSACASVDRLLGFPDEITLMMAQQGFPLASSRFPPGQVVALIGPPGTGKTQFALQLVAQSLLQTTDARRKYHSSQHSCWYLSSDAALNSLAKRLEAIASSLLSSRLSARQQVLQRTSFASVQTEYELLQTLSVVEERLVKHHADLESRPLIIVIDSLGGLKDRGEGDETTKRLVDETVKRLARTYFVFVLVIGHKRPKRWEQRTKGRDCEESKVVKSDYVLAISDSDVRGGRGSLARLSFEHHPMRQTDHEDHVLVEVSNMGIEEVLL